MSIDLQQMQLAYRAKLATLSVCTTGSTSLGATGTTFTRAGGSFLTDGFYVGMEVKGTGFGALNNAAANVVDVAALTLTVNRTLVTEVASAGRTLSVGLPSKVAYENDDFADDDLEPGEPFFEEEFLPGPTMQLTAGDGGTIKAEPTLILSISVPKGTGVGASNGYRKALLSLFAPKVVMTLTNGDFLRVRTDPGPWAEQLLQLRPGWATTPVNIPLRLYTINS